jgi:hypothetical protein
LSRIFGPEFAFVLMPPLYCRQPMASLQALFGGYGMALNRHQQVKLFTAGTATIPPTYPDPGTIVFEAHAFEIAGQIYDVLRVSYHAAPSETITTTVRLQDVIAILWEMNGKIDPIQGDWSIGPEVSPRVRNAPPGPLPPGIVFVQRGAATLVLAESGIAAGEVSAYCDPCCRP